MRDGPAPTVFEYLSFRDYLRDWFQSQKAADRRFSHRLFARRASVRSPSLLLEVMEGRRNLTDTTTAGFARALRLSAEETRFFADLVMLDQAPDPEQKNAAWERVAASRRFRRARSIDGAAVRYLSHWYYPAIRELALRADFRDDPSWIGRQLLPAIPASKAQEALDELVALGMLIREEGRAPRPAEVTVATPHAVAGLAVYNYHRQMLERAAEALTLAEPDERHLCAVTVCIPSALVPRLKEELDAMQERLLHLCDEHACDAERVYQINLQLVPLSRARGGGA